MSSKKFPEISNALREREHHSRTVLRKAIHESSGQDRNYAWMEKRDYGSSTRHLLLVYCMLRGMPRDRCEKNSGTFPSIYLLGCLCRDYGHPRTQEWISAWVNGLPLPEQMIPPPEPAKKIEEPRTLVGTVLRALGVSS